MEWAAKQQNITTLWPQWRKCPQGSNPATQFFFCWEEEALESEVSQLPCLWDDNLQSFLRLWYWGSRQERFCFMTVFLRHVLPEKWNLETKKVHREAIYHYYHPLKWSLHVSPTSLRDLSHSRRRSRTVSLLLGQLCSWVARTLRGLEQCTIYGLKFSTSSAWMVPC